jgi:hypothetical protein
MKKNLLRSGLVLMLMVGLFACSFFTTEPAALAADEFQLAKNAITVQGTSSITVTPTIAYVNIGVTTFHKDAAIALSDNAKKMDLVYETLVSLGIGKEKIKTISFYISPRYEYKDNSSTLVGYEVTNGIQVTVMDLTKVSQVLDMTVKQGINQANSISFGITDQEKDTIYLQVLAKAVANAEAKANTLAAAVGVSLIKPAQITEGSTGYMVPAGYGISDTVKAENVATPISGGELKVEANVTVIYNY